MWKKALQILVQSCVYMDPYGYLYHAAARRAAGERARREQDEAEEEHILRLIETLESRRKEPA